MQSSECGMKNTISAEAGPLHLTRKSDCLDIDLGQADLDIYDINTK